MSKQLLQNRGFENDLTGYITQGKVSVNSDIAYSGTKSALLISTPNSIAEISQVVFFLTPGSLVRFSFLAKKHLIYSIKNKSNVRAEVNFVSSSGAVIPPGIAITVRGRDISENVWNLYDGYSEVPAGATAAQVVITLEPPDYGNSGLLVDDLALVTEIAQPAPPYPSLVPPLQQGIPPFPVLPFVNPFLPGIQNLLSPGSPLLNLLFPDLPFSKKPQEAPKAGKDNTDPEKNR